MTPLERVRNLVAGLPVDHLPAQPMVILFAAAHAGFSPVDYAKDGRKMAEGQLKTAEDYGIDCLLSYSDQARAVHDIAGPDSIDWLPDRGPVVNEERAALALAVRLKELRVPDPFGGGRMHEQIKAIEFMRQRAGEAQSVVGWIDGPLALAQFLRGPGRLSGDFQADPAFVSDLLDFTAEVAVRCADAQIRSGADTIGIGDGGAAALGQVLYEKFLLPRHLRVLEAMKMRHPEVLTRLNVRGNADALIPKMLMLPIDIFEFDCQTDVAAARAWLGQGRVISGNMCPAGDMLQGMPKKITDAARKCHRICGKYHIVSCGGEVPAKTPPENLKALIRYAREHQPSAP